MQINSSIWLLLLASAVLIALALMLFRKRAARPAEETGLAQAPEVVAPRPDCPNRIIIGSSPDSPLVTIEALSSPEDYERGKQLDTHNSTSIDRLTALCQSVPSLLVAGEASGKRLMEVVVNGDLVRASDGNGLRAFAMASDGITEHARLFDIQNLQNAINAAAIWQIASVVVAQKHLADISRKLDEIKKGVAGISRFLDNQRKSRIQATYTYLGQIYRALQGGDLPNAGRHHLENCEHDLLEIQHHLVMEYRQKVDQKVKHKEAFGTADLTSDISAKMEELDLLANDVVLCIKTRIAAWHVLSLFPGEPQLKLARRASIHESIEAFGSLAPFFQEALNSEISAVDALWNTEATLRERRRSLASKSDSSGRSLQHKAQQARQHVEHIEQLMLNNDQPMHLLLQFENGTLVGARQRAYATA